MTVDHHPITVMKPGSLPGAPAPLPAGCSVGLVHTWEHLGVTLQREAGASTGFYENHVCWERNLSYLGGWSKWILSWRPPEATQKPCLKSEVKRAEDTALCSLGSNSNAVRSKHTHAYPSHIHGPLSWSPLSKHTKPNHTWVWTSRFTRQDPETPVWPLLLLHWEKSFVTAVYLRDGKYFF